MEEKRVPEIRNHRLAHIPTLKIDPIVFESKFSHGCSMSNCDATCCQHGAMVDLPERDKILQNADLIKQHMEPEQEHDTSRWFDADDEEDEDFFLFLFLLLLLFNANSFFKILLLAPPTLFVFFDFNNLSAIFLVIRMAGISTL
mgnify:CR=1 FL=1